MFPGDHLGRGRESLAHLGGAGLRSPPGPVRDFIGDKPQRGIACRGECHEHGAGKVARPGGWWPHPGGVADEPAHPHDLGYVTAVRFEALPERVVML
jgi:hypothetical protein